MADEAKSGQSIHDQKEVAWYSAAVQGWITTRLELDRSLLTLSVAALGLLVTVLTNKITSFEGLLLYLLAAISFILCIFVVLLIFRLNSDVLERDIANQTTGTTGKLLSLLDKTAVSSFLLGVIFTTVIGLSTAYHEFRTKELEMSNEKPPAGASSKNTSLNPQMLKSLHGFGGLKQPAPAPAPAPAPSPAPATGESQPSAAPKAD